MSDLDARMLRRLTFVPRWTIMPTIRKQSVAEHTFGVMVIARRLIARHSNYADSEFVLGCLNTILDHDMDEALTGDVASPSKPYKPPTIDTPQIDIVVGCADYLEAIMFIHEEQFLGNRMGTQNVLEYLFSRLHDQWYWFEWAEGIQERKWITSDLVKWARRLAFDPEEPHPRNFK